MTNVSCDRIPADMTAFDIGDETRGIFKEAVSRAGTVLWNGPIGAYERESFQGGTLAIARAISGSAAYSVVCGRHSVRAVEELMRDFLTG